ncbi:hypothetical protein GHT06_020704 [Daphnia sinensis]|uniref:Uncharacterized protein n=1 Tax=Daphnia sinensis TaxID=1820382 RepID=A0AAD5KI32_9CRUS|nr:hypothetical protein GHT06_020704 [Daphnia sinensis]
MSIKQRSVSSWITLAKVRSHGLKSYAFRSCPPLVLFIPVNVHQVYHRLLYSGNTRANLPL